MQASYYVRFSYPHWDPNITQRVRGWRNGIQADSPEKAIERFWSMTGFSPAIVTIDECTKEATHYLPLEVARVSCGFVDDASRLPMTTERLDRVTCEHCIADLERGCG